MVRLDRAKDDDFKGVVKVLRNGVEINRGQFTAYSSEYGNKFEYGGVWWARMLFERDYKAYYPDDEIEKLDYRP